MKDFHPIIEDISGKEDFLSFLGKFISDYKENPEAWDNKTLINYLEGIEGWVEDMEGYYKNNNLNHVDLVNINWRVFADILSAARIYE